ncbi:EcsC family protein [Fictibacillus phosphorivorans]|uniref:EcsC family protein n=1 Tax=Fictibacillus phosphorivorans TaxID=1221500 RepID=UPI001293646E|nr:EcsC family protein [Fictibacillus phosphorivorans]MQR96218.1 EcsC family protein [Fictibacillus phosphorivorans]
MESKEFLLKELQQIEKWEKDQKGLWFWERITRLPFKVLDKVTPKFIQNKIGTLLDEIGGYIQNGGQYLTKEKSVFQFYEKQTGRIIHELADFKTIPVEEMKNVSLELANKRKSAATLQGASTGIGGIFTLAIDIPAILAISLKTLQEIAIIHGYDPNDKEERVYILKCLQFSTSDYVGKEAILNDLAAISEDEMKSREVISQIQGWREVTLIFTESFGWKKLFQMVPIAGIIFGAFANRSMINDLAETGTMLYQKRRIVERLKSDTTPKSIIESQ